MATNLYRKMIACVLVVLSWSLPLVALPNQEVIGKVVGSNAASLDGVALPNGGTILNNDLLKTRTGGKALVELSTASRLSLSEHTTARFLRQGTVDVAAISSGALVAETQRGNSLVVQTDKYKIELLHGVKTVCLVAIMPDRSTVVASKDGRVSITEISSGLKYILPEGKYAVIPAAASGVPGQAVQETQQTIDLASPQSGKALSLTFTSEQVGAFSGLDVVTVTNSGTSSISINAIRIEGASDVDFNMTGNCGTSIEPNSSCFVNLTFSPTATGTRTATLTIAGGSYGPRTVTLMGVGSPGAAGPPTRWHVGSLSHAASVGLVVAIAAGTAAAIAIPLAVSGGAVSPSTP